ncbi:3-demethylubiquinone-9 3-methyltransferase [Coxiella-like endosymbiont]|uniref:bifunctional 2-polyprenyl-6-hydroxyphenol methylase/3-demethylubiquinol 3-O-methyltransferase UbiG n=2 Tax=Coxiella-like endosymbiont TaxID=1592897 RepID=UPI000C80B9B6|nr:bifunctional 2-polyprenyl-6-hydroxyphenol methylase/3-demethylubiquinol 3-O-methyltransferase UbiG [Coxiella-like endosymbiont]PMB55022.1 3-demethylubiquinone-9 3-methyltransferase [Coxiella-like endosymbiont]
MITTTTKKMNINSEEVFKFSKMAEEWWNPKGQIKLLHLMNATRVQYIQEHAVLKNKQVLDVGCGGGLLSEALAKHAAQVTAIDMSDALIKIAKKHAQQEQLNIDYRCEDVEIFVNTTKRFDIVICMELLEHIPNPAQMLQTCARLTKPGGKLFCSTINRTLKAYLFTIIGAEYLLNWLPKGTHKYAQFIRPSELIQWTKNVQFHLVHMSGLNYHPFRNKFNLSMNVSVNYLACFSKNYD